MKDTDKDYVSTKEVKMLLKTQDCDVMHLRVAGQIKYLKKGNAFMYLRSDVERLRAKKFS